MKIGMVKQVEVEAKTIEIYAKVRDSGTYTLKDQDGKDIAERDDYVPSDIFPGDSGGDYLDLKIDLETGQILNWDPPTAAALQEAFNLNGKSDD